MRNGMSKVWFFFFGLSTLLLLPIWGPVTILVALGRKIWFDALQFRRYGSPGGIWLFGLGLATVILSPVWISLGAVGIVCTLIGAFLFISIIEPLMKLGHFSHRKVTNARRA